MGGFSGARAMTVAGPGRMGIAGPARFAGPVRMGPGRVAFDILNPAPCTLQDFAQSRTVERQ